MGSKRLSLKKDRILFFNCTLNKCRKLGWSHNVSDCICRSNSSHNIALTMARKWQRYQKVATKWRAEFKKLTQHLWIKCLFHCFVIFVSCVCYPHLSHCNSGPCLPHCSACVLLNCFSLCAFRAGALLIAMWSVQSCSGHHLYSITLP